ncbi:MAG: flagellar M-ring protein FliF, partial [Fimbriimonadaceae bacterium]|nr:flagellar M-ring protein FliF [Alphaproteobacteria bacterium]
MNGVIEFVKTLGPGRIAAMGAVAVGLIGFFAFLILRLSQPHMVTLYADLDMQDSSSIIRELEATNIPFELRADGAVILVPKENVLRLRMQLAEDGLPLGGSVGYELFDKGDALGTTSFVQNLNHLRALEGELARTIRSIDQIQSVRVHLVLPKREVFSRENASPTASIVVRARGDLDTGHIRSIQHLVASAVNGLQPSKVAIVDEAGRLLASGTEGTDAMAAAASFEERGQALETRLRNQIKDIVESVVGPGHARVNVNAELDFNRISQTSDKFDPESQVARTTQTREETANSREGAANNGVSLGSELPGAAEEQNTNGAEENNNKVEETVTYEISRTTTTEVIEAGRIKQLAVAVLVDGIYATDANGTITYQDRSQEEMDQIAALVRSSMGFDRERGDQLEIVNLRFAAAARPEALAEEGGLFDFTKDDYLKIAEMVILFIISALVLLFVIRPLVRRILAPDGTAN